MKKLIALAGLIFAFTPLFAVSDSGMEKNMVRMENFLEKIKSGREVTVVALGGSITTGFASNPIKTNSWAGLTEKYLKELAQKNNCVLNFYNQGVSGTDSAFAIARLDDHVMSLKPDLVILEFAMNDQWLDAMVRQRTYEAIIRKIMNNTETAMLALFVNERAAPYPSNQKEQQKICEYYDIPYVSWKDCMEKDGLLSDFEKCFDGAETVHPNNTGHAKIAYYIQQKINQMWAALPAEDKLPKVEKKLPEPLTDKGFVNAKYYAMDNIKPVTNTGWTEGSPVHSEWVQHGNSHKGWETKTAGAEITFDVDGSGVGITYCESDQFRDATAWVTFADGTNSTKIPLQNYVSYRKGYYGWAYRELVNTDTVQKFTVHIQCSKRAPKSAEGKSCNITGILVAGEKK